MRSLGDAALAYEPVNTSLRTADGSTGLAGGLLDDLRRELPIGSAGQRRVPVVNDLREDQLELTSALRAGIEANRLSVGTAGLSLGLPSGVDPFDYFADLPPQVAAAGAGLHRQDIPELRSPRPRRPGPCRAAGGHGVARRSEGWHGWSRRWRFGQAPGRGRWRGRDREAPRASTISPDPDGPEWTSDREKRNRANGLLTCAIPGPNITSDAGARW